MTPLKHGFSVRMFSELLFVVYVLTFGAGTIESRTSTIGKILKLYVFKLSRRLNCIKSSGTDSRASCIKTSDVSQTHSVSILREQ
jgi:hypothetical protein